MTLAEWSRPRLGRECRGLLITSLLALVALLVAAPEARAQPRPFGVLDCRSQQGVRFCPGSIDTRIKSFDGVPLDVNVALPPVGERFFPLVVLLKGWGADKHNLSGMREWALAGYATLSFAQRGFANSCGTLASRDADPAGCARGWTHVGDSRYEARDVQHLAGRLVDEGLVRPHRIGITGNSYGGAVALMLAALRDSVQLQDGTLVPWRSPGRRVAMSVAAAAPFAGWSDFLHIFAPNGRNLDYTVAQPGEAAAPFGALKGSYWSWFYGLGAGVGYYAPFGEDPSADIEAWNAFLTGGEPYDPAAAGQIAQELQTYHAPAFVGGSASAAPLFIGSGFPDDLIPADEVTRFANRFPGAVMAQFYGDLGHPRAQKKPEDLALRSTLIRAWFDRHVKGDTSVPAPAGVTALTQTCPGTVPSGGPLTAPSWASLHPGEVRHEDSEAKLVLSTADSLGSAVDPLGSSVTACSTSPGADQSGTATYRLPPVAEPGYTLLGSPTVIAELAVPEAVAADSTQLAARLWDVDPGGEQTLVARGLYRPSGSGRVVFQLHPNGWHFAAGHSPKLELLGQDSAYARLSNFTFSLGVSNLELRLPTAEPPDQDEVQAPQPPVLPPGATPAP